jgi:transposase InsO family protein
VIVELVEEAVCAGARIDKACEQLGVCARSVARWRKRGGGEDRRKGPVTPAAHKLSPEEEKRIIETANLPEYRNLSPRQIVPLLADKGIYIASESTFYRVLAKAGQMAHRHRARPAAHRKPMAHVARRPNEVWSWDITYLRSRVRGQFYYLYLVVDVFSRKIVGFEVHAEECAVKASELVSRAVDDEGVDRNRLVLHADNGGPMKASTMLATLERLGVVASFSRPRVSDDNPFAEALFRTMKYRPGYPSKPFATLEQARAWVLAFVAWYNDEHLHSAIRYVTPAARHDGRDVRILAERRSLYAAAKRRTPRRWSGSTRNRRPVGAVFLNPVRQEVRTPPLAVPIQKS